MTSHAGDGAESTRAHGEVLGDKPVLTPVISSLRRDLSAFEGRNLTVLGEIAVRYQGCTDYLDGLVTLADDADGKVSSGSTWLLKAHLEAGGDLTRKQSGRLISCFANVDDWTSTLHLCQSVRYLVPNSQEAEHIVRSLRPLLAHDRPFLRAWSLDALCHVSSLHSAFADMAKDALDAAARDPAASVRARARNLTSRPSSSRSATTRTGTSKSSG